MLFAGGGGGRGERGRQGEAGERQGEVGRGKMQGEMGGEAGGGGERERQEEVGEGVVFESPVRSSYLVPRGSNRDRDRLAFVPKPKIT